jgi:hypothetical protein
MMNDWRSGIGAVGISLLAACDPGFNFHGHIADVNGKPVANVQASVVCDGVMQFSAVSDSEGRFSTHPLGWRPNACEIHIDPPARPPLRLSVADHCAVPRGDDACLGVWVDLILP